MHKIRKIRGGKMESFARLVANIFFELAKRKKSGLGKCHRGVVLDIRKDDKNTTPISQWKIGEIDSCLYSMHDLLISMCIDNFTSKTRPLSSRELEDKNLAVAIRVKRKNAKLILAISGLTKEANEAILILAAVNNDYLCPNEALQMIQQNQNQLLLNLQR